MNTENAIASLCMRLGTGHPGAVILPHAHRSEGIDQTVRLIRSQIPAIFYFRLFIVARVNAGLARARASGTKSGKAIGRPRIKAKIEQRIREELAAGHGILKVASIVGVGSGTVQRVAKALRHAISRNFARPFCVLATP